ncbi:pyridine nucleotide-disulfide oxidoreductase/dicluster-binding protein [Maridesulfovibrio hydrothermalis]|uniref:4Fe-4S ferredoxin iron-sulfur binding domain protein n=1 Tax=Maridesulfovibrio hydrothermalis AM13 = DSM 14728 TaxID=1121451 RepID=L0R922_9BACT|nr:pyridine nucleotide-disulfide oxidoreductase/dicluster-binding protein [Maridesulfovibrio hydrothermalis]CCO22722.1 4Fe-4S ferredoxin iron-sulfur binding domain protein [Maridesulfovibrio hydrothermalis AM13 = DSM 14728]
MDQKDLRKWEARCTQEEPARCKAMCPLHVDGRELCKLIAAGQIDKAWAVLCKTMPFPAVTARVCDGDCQEACLRSKIGGGIELAGLERFCAENAKRTPPMRALPARGKNIAVIGAYLPGLAAAWDLGKKGFTVKVLCESRFEGFDGLPAGRVEKETFEKELSQLGKMNVSFIEKRSPAREIVYEALEDFDAVFADPVACDAAKLHISDPDATTLKTTKEGLFASVAPDDCSVISLIALGRKGALSIERTMQGAALSAGRDREDPFESRLFTNISKVEPVSIVALPEAGYSVEQAREEAKRCLLCECMECVHNCAYLEEFKSYPKAYARQIYNNASIVMGTRRANNLINSCMLCGLCEDICPENFSMKELCIDARRDLVEKGNMPPSAHEFALRDMEFADSSTCSLVKHEQGTDESRQIFFPGCQLTASDPSAVEKTYSYLCSALEGGTGMILRCCGAPADWSGQVDVFGRKTESLERDWNSLGRPQIIAACPSCIESLRKGLPEADIVSLWSVISSDRDNFNIDMKLKELSLQDPCSARHNYELMTDVRLLLNDMNVDFNEPELSGSRTECCGFGGLLSDANEPLSRKVAESRAEKLTGDGITYCAMCRDLLAKTGKRCMHMLDILFPSESDDPAARPAPGYSERRENRVRLKENLLNNLWCEPSHPRPDYESIAVNFTDEAREMMEKRRILLSDIQKTLQFAQESERDLENVETGHRLVHFRPVTVTYWVEFEKKDGDKYLVHRVWSHRMQILGVV